jgi:hypothetical protein
LWWQIKPGGSECPQRKIHFLLFSNIGNRSRTADFADCAAAQKIKARLADGKPSFQIG